MYEHFDQTQDFSATLLIERKEQGDCNVRIRYNPYDLNNMEAELFGAPVQLSIPGLPDRPSFADYHDLDVRLVERRRQDRRVVVLRPAEIKNLEFRPVRGTHSTTIPVKEYVSEQRWEADEDDEVRLSVAFQFPLTTAVRIEGSATLDSRYGYYRGERKLGDETIDINDDSFYVDTDLGKVEFLESFDIDENKSNRIHPGILLIRRSECLFQTTCKVDECDEVLEQAREQIDQLLDVLSFTEQNRINWTIERVTVYSENELTVRKTTYRWASPTSDDYRPERSHHREAKKGFRALWDAYRKLHPSKKEVIDQALYNFQSAHCSGVLETQLVFYHACLDHLLGSVYECYTRPFSKRLVQVCDENDVGLDDLFEKDVIDHFRCDPKEKNACFWFVDARNRLVHDGLFQLNDTPYQMIDAIRAVCAVSERLLMNAMGIDHDDLFDADGRRPGGISI